jgi:hypothetical protein
VVAFFGAATLDADLGAAALSGPAALSCPTPASRAGPAGFHSRAAEKAECLRLLARFTIDTPGCFIVVWHAARCSIMFSVRSATWPLAATIPRHNLKRGIRMISRDCSMLAGQDGAWAVLRDDARDERCSHIQRDDSSPITTARTLAARLSPCSYNRWTQHRQCMHSGGELMQETVGKLWEAVGSCALGLWLVKINQLLHTTRQPTA